MQPPTRGPEKKKPSGPAPADLMGAGIQLAISIVVFLFAGQWLDARFGTSPLLLIAGVFVGFGASFYSIYRRLVPPSGRGRHDPPEGR